VHKVLIVEDDEDVREVLRESLEDEGFWVLCARNGQEGLDMARAEPEPCLILLDLLMPGVSGWQFRAQQLQDPLLARFPVIVMTATTTLEEAAVHAEGLLRKPVRFDALIREVGRFCTPADFAESPPTQQWVPREVPRDDSGPHS
jgi:CheY-like chemotaxis protein